MGWGSVFVRHPSFAKDPLAFARGSPFLPRLPLRLPLDIEGFQIRGEGIDARRIARPALKICLRERLPL